MSAADIVDSAAEIIESAKAVKGDAFVAKARIALFLMTMGDMAAHTAECGNPECAAQIALLSAAFAKSALAALLIGMTETDADELTKLIVQLRSKTNELSKHNHNPGENHDH